MMKATTVNKVRELTGTSQPDSLKPDSEADIIFTATEDITTVCRNYGQVSTQGLPDPSNCCATGEGIEVAVVGEKSTAVLQAMNFKGAPCKETIKSLECEVVSDITGSTIRCSIKRRGESQYEISYQPTIKGRHQLHIRVEGQHIKRSPFGVAVKSSVEKLGTPLLTLSCLNVPEGVAVNQRGEVAVTEYLGHCVSVFSPQGEKLCSFGSEGSHHGQLNNPCGVTFDGEGNILVADHSNHRIQKFTAKGHFLMAVGTKGDGPLQFNFPYGIAFNPSNNKVYVTDGNHHIRVLNSDLTFCSTFGKEGKGKGQFEDPRGVACDGAGNVYVADRNNHRIEVFTAAGKFLRMFGRCGHGRGELSCPIGVGVDTSGLVYVSERENHRVSVFSSEGQFVTSFGKKGKGPGELQYPHGVAVDNSGVVFVCDLNNSLVQLF